MLPCILNKLKTKNWTNEWNFIASHLQVTMFCSWNPCLIYEHSVVMQKWVIQFYLALSQTPPHNKECQINYRNDMPANCQHVASSYCCKTQKVACFFLQKVCNAKQVFVTLWANNYGVSPPKLIMAHFPIH